MDSTKRRSPLNLVEHIQREPFKFEVFQVLRVLSQNEDHLDLRLRTPANLAFPPSELSDARTSNDGFVELDVAVMGLTGPLGVLPQVYTEWLQQRRIDQKDHSAHAFLDTFSQRFIEIFFEARRARHPALRFEQNENDHFVHYLQDLIGLGASNQWQQGISENENCLSSRFTAFFAGQLLKRPACSGQLQQIIADFFSVDASVESFCPHIVLLGNQKTSLGIEHSALGVDCALGDSVTQYHDRFLISIGPLRLDRFSSFLQGTENANAIASLVKYCFGHEFSCELQLILHKDDLCSPQLGGNAMLGLNTFMSLTGSSHHAADVRYELVH